MSKPFEVQFPVNEDYLDNLVDDVFSDLQSQFLILPKATSFVEYQEFQAAYQILKRVTSAFDEFSGETVWAALEENALCFGVLRSILGLTPPEWAELARSEVASDISQGYARQLDNRSKVDSEFFKRMPKGQLSYQRARSMVDTAIALLKRGAPPAPPDTVHRLGKVDTAYALASLRHVATHDVPYPMLLYERFLGRPFATYRDSISEKIGDIMESAIEVRLTEEKVSFRKTARAEKVPGYDQAPDFFVPDEFNPAVLIEAKITNDDGTARDKVARILRLTGMRDQRRREGKPAFEIVACIDGRGFGVRREDMRTLLVHTEGKSVYSVNSRSAGSQYSAQRVQARLTSNPHWRECVGVEPTPD